MTPSLCLTGVATGAHRCFSTFDNHDSLVGKLRLADGRLAVGGTAPPPRTLATLRVAVDSSEHPLRLGDEPVSPSRLSGSAQHHKGQGTDDGARAASADGHGSRPRRSRGAVLHHRGSARSRRRGLFLRCPRRQQQLKPHARAQHTVGPAGHRCQAAGRVRRH